MEVHPIARLTEFTNSGDRLAVDGIAGFFVVWEAGDTPESPTLEQAKKIARARFYAIAATKIAQLTAEYSFSEQIGWPGKEQEAKDFRATNDPGLCPNLSAIALLRGVPLETLVDTVLSKAAELRAEINSIDAERGRLSDLVAGSETVSEVQAIIWE